VLPLTQLPLSELQFYGIAGDFKTFTENKFTSPLKSVIHPVFLQPKCFELCDE